MKYDGWPQFNGKPVNPKLLKPLNKIPPDILKIVKPRVTQGAGNARASRGTHLQGFCVDFYTKKLGAQAITMIIGALEDAGFAAALRLPGDAGPTEHIHAALRPYANSEAVWLATREGGVSNLKAKLKSRR